MSTHTLQATLDAIALLQTVYDQMIADATPSVIRRIIYRVQATLEADARRMLTGE